MNKGFYIITLMWIAPLLCTEDEYLFRKACSNSDISSLRELVYQPGIGTYIRKHKDDLLWSACHNDRYEVFEFLVQRVDVGAENGELLLNKACAMGSFKIVKCLIARINTNWPNFKETPLHVATSHGRYEIVKFLISFGNERQRFFGNGININAQNSEGETALHIAIEKGHVDIVELLLAMGADVNIKKKNGITPLKLAKSKKNFFAIKLLKTYKAKK